MNPNGGAAGSVGDLAIGIGRVADFHGGPSGKVDGQARFGVMTCVPPDQRDALIDIPDLDFASHAAVGLAISDSHPFRAASIRLVD